MWRTQLLLRPVAFGASRRYTTSALTKTQAQACIRRLPHHHHQEQQAAAAVAAVTSRRSLATIQPDRQDQAQAAEAAPEALADNIRDFLMSTRQRPRAGLKPDELLVKCPECSPGKPRRLAYSAHLSTHTGDFVCTSCFAQGSWDKYRELATRRPFQNSIPRTARTAEQEPFEIDDEALVQLQHNLREHEAAWQGLTGQGDGQLRLTPEVLAQYGVGLGFVDCAVPEIVDMRALASGSSSPSAVPCLVFPRTAFRTNSFIDAAGSGAADAQQVFRTVQVKAVGFQAGDVQMYYPADDAQPGLFGFHVAAGAQAGDVVLTGRELDALAAFQATGIPAVSLPRGAYQLPLDAMRALERFERVYVWLDDDHQGTEAARLIARKLGVDRCLVVGPQAGGDGARSAGDALARGLDLAALLDAAQPLQHDKVLAFAALRDAVKFEVTNPELIRGVPSTDLPGWNACFKGLRPGELTILSGATGCGKTTVASQLSLDFCRSGVSTLWGSFEIPNVRLATRMMSQFARRDISQAPSEIDYWARKFEQLPMYFLKFHGSTRPDTVLETMRHAVYAYDVKHIVIDNLQFMMSMQAKGIDKYDAQDAAIATFRQFATDENVHITVVAHLRKDGQPQSGAATADADINSIFGSAKVTQEADNVVILQRHGNAATDNKIRRLSVLKNRFDGTLGKVFISYSTESLTFHEIPPPRQRKSVKVVKAVSGKLTKADRQMAESMAAEHGFDDDMFEQSQSQSQSQSVSQDAADENIKEI
ncbi:hypothetical protein LPJ66_002692 [Kickxella alabastrina]|uniref:Uncharacterized protein n=1 Tax=Kickxella alabastrina TaxID=61397 RepID=A0ACC1IPQ8_9FUNG|nr:hypothetical protein LPJ66_002692 [Kickxella alabastrina]